jgi:hypothetical protein
MCENSIIKLIKIIKREGGQERVPEGEFDQGKLYASMKILQ